MLLDMVRFNFKCDVEKIALIFMLDAIQFGGCRRFQLPN